MTRSQWVRRVWKPLVFILCLGPFALLAFQWYAGSLSANPISDVTNTTGTWTLRFLMIALSVTPLRKLTGWNWLLQFRRMIGLFAFFSVTLHFFTYIYLDQFFLWDEIFADIRKRPFILVGFTSFVLMIPLALTSTDSITKWLGARRWRRLHRIVYGIALGGVVHYLWLVKADTHRPLAYGAILVALLTARVWFALRSKVASQRSSSPPVAISNSREGAAGLSP